MDEYAQRIAALKDEQYEISGIVAPLRQDDPVREWYAQRAGEVAREIVMLMDNGERLRRLDARIIAVDDALASHERQVDDRVDRWRTAARFAGLLTAVALFVKLVGGSWWWGSAGFVLVMAFLFAQVRIGRLTATDDPRAEDYDRELRDLLDQRAAILDSAYTSYPLIAAASSAMDDGIETREFAGVPELPRDSS